jgi:protease-4
LGILLALIIVAAGGWFLWNLLLHPPAPTIHRGTWLVVDFDGDFPEERPEQTGLESWVAGRPLSAQELYLALDRAARDPRIEGVLLRPDLFAGGWAQAEEIRSSLVRVRDAGKPVWAWLQVARPAPYFLATACDSISMAPEGNLLITGLQARFTHLKGTLDKIGVRAEFISIGRYKSYHESFTRDSPSEPARRQVEAYVDAVYGSWIEALGHSRGLARTHVADLVDRGVFDAEGAVAEGLVDRVLDEVGLWDRLQPGREEPRTVDPRGYLEARWSEAGADRSRRLALLYATGQIVPGAAPGGEGVLAGGTLVERLQRAADDDRVVAVVLRVDSPGGSTLASDLIWREVERVRRRKPVVVSMANVAASGGYYISMSADRILADPLTLTGSIGVFLAKADLGGLYQKLGVTHETIQRGANADLFSDLRPFSAAQREDLTRLLESFYDRFVERVAAGRGLSFSQADSAARGRVWSGRDALAQGLVDELGGLWEALGVAKELAGIPPGSRLPLVTYQREPGLLDRVMRDLLQSRAPSAAMPRVLSESLATLRWVAPLVDGTPQFHLPWLLRIR